jgi:hypothetical protein
VALLFEGELVLAAAAAELEEVCARLTIDRKVIVRKERTAVLTTTPTSLGKVAGLPSQEHTPPSSEPVLGKGGPIPADSELTEMIPRSFDSGGRQGENLWESN